MKGNIRNYESITDIPPFHIAKWGTTDTAASVAGDSADALIGVSVDVLAKAGTRVDIAEDGPHSITLGGPVTRGDFLTAGSGGKAVKCVSGNYIAQAKQSGVAGDIIYCHICRGYIAAST